MSQVGFFGKIKRCAADNNQEFKTVRLVKNNERFLESINK